jgi:hypothetical protein
LDLGLLIGEVDAQIILIYDFRALLFDIKHQPATQKHSILKGVYTTNLEKKQGFKKNQLIHTKNNKSKS